ncbi:lipid phosphate phosphatase 2-like [Actinidia eriantha]|uniref:lipid phosphate phosphatase 2-like n=1 Tax=Actinidia eriantha TaxID=165200 RepID=UPI00258B7583|nr:lipid phosphate phosphatase 2-like [Actinidia eriantha]
MRRQQQSIVHGSSKTMAQVHLFFYPTHFPASTLVILTYYFIRRDVYDFHHAILGLLFSVLITGVITDAIKNVVGRTRPDFFWRCFLDGKGVFNSITRNIKCTRQKSFIKEGQTNFPSRHMSYWQYDFFLA